MARNCNSNNKRNSSTTKKSNSTRRPRRSEPKYQGVPGSNKPGRNDLSWWAKNPELLASAARVPFAKRPGTHLDEKRYYFPPASGVTHCELRTTIPGVMSIWYDYTIGISRDVTSAASITAKELFARIRAAFSGALDEDAPDLFMYVMALDQIHAYIAWLKRLYRTINAYSSDNYYYPELVFAAQITDGNGELATASNIYNELRQNKVGLWNLINTLVNMVNKFNCPKNMDIFERHRWMNEHVYSDINEVRGQVYVFAPVGFFTLFELGPDGTELVYNKVSEFNWSAGALTALSEFGYAMLASLSAWDDAYTINGHIQRAFEGTEFYGATLIAQDEQLAPVYNEEVLLQIHNLTVVENFRQSPITQNPDDNSIVYEPIWEVSNTEVHLDLPGIAPTAEAVVLATRLSAAASPSNGGTCCTEVVTKVRITAAKHMVSMDVTTPYKIGFVDLPTNMFLGFPLVTNTPTTLDTVRSNYELLIRKLKLLAYVQAWKWAPRMYISAACCNYNYNPAWTPTADEEALMSSSATAWVSGEVDNLATISYNDLSELHRVCLYSVFNCFGK